MSKKARGKGLLALASAVAGISSLFSNNQIAHAATTLTWGTSSAPDASGAWDNITPDWGQGAGVVWASADVAAFGNTNSAAAYTVTLGNVSAAGLTFNSVTSTYTLAGGTLTLGGNPITLNNDATIDSVITGTSGLAVVGTTNTTLSLGGANNYTGSTSLSGSGTVVQLAAANALSTTTTLALASNTTLDLNGSNQTLASLYGNSGISGNITNTSATFATLTITNGESPYPFSFSNPTLNAGQFSGNLTIVQSGGFINAAGMAGNQNGDYYLNGGTLSINPGAQGFVGTHVLHLGNGTIENGCCSGVVITNTLSLDGNTGFYQETNQGFSFTGNATLTGYRTFTLGPSWTPNADNFPILQGTVGDGGGNYGFTITGNGALALLTSGANTFTGSVTIAGGALLWDGSNSLGAPVASVYQTIIMGDPTGANTTANVSLYANNQNINNGSATLNNNINVLAGSGTATIGALGACCNSSITGTYAGNITFARNLVLDDEEDCCGHYGISLFSGSVSETVPNSGMSITKNGLGVAIFNAPGDTTGPTFTGGTYINAGTIQWNYNTTNNDGGNGYSLDQFGGTPSGGPGTITLNGGSFEFAVNGATSSEFEYLMNPIVVTAASGGLYGANDNANQIAGFAGPISLGGSLSIGVRASTSSTTNNYFFYYGSSITLQNAADGVGRALIENTGINSSYQNVAVQSVVADPIYDSAVGGNGAPLILRAALTNFTIEGYSAYNDGTVIEAGYYGNTAGVVNVTGGATLGTGNVYIQSGASVLLNSNTNIGQSVSLISTQGAASVLGLNADMAPSFLAGTVSGGVLTASGAGVVALDATSGSGFNGALATVGNGGTINLGSLFLGGSGQFTGSSLAAGNIATVAGNTAATYRLGGGGNNSDSGINNTLTISSSNVLTGNTNLIVGLPGVGTEGSGGDSSATHSQNLIGAVVLQGAQTFTGNILVNPESTLEGYAVTGGTPFGSTTNTITLTGGTLKIDGTPGTSLNTTVGNLNIDGYSSLVNQFLSAPGSTVNTLTITNLNRATVTGTDGGGTSYSYGGGVLNLGTANGTLGAQSKIFITNFNGTGNTPTLNTPGGIVAPWITDVSGNYYTYGANGLAIVTYTLNGVAGGTANGTTGHLLSSGISTDNVLLTGSDSSVTSNVTVNSIDGMSLPYGGAGITLGSGATLTILSGGLSLSNGANLSGSGAAALQIGASGTGELFFNDGFNQESQISIPIYATNATLFGPGNVTFTGNNGGTLFGTLTLDNGELTIGATNSLGSVSTIVMNGGRLFPTNQLTITQNIVLGTGGGAFDSGSNDTTNVLAGNISGPGNLNIEDGGQGIIELTGYNTYSGGTLIGANQGRGLYVGPTSSIGTGDLTVIGGGYVYFEGSNGTSNTAHVEVAAGNSVEFEQSANAIGSLDGAGSVTLGGSATGPFVSDTAPSRNVTLTIGGNNASTEWDGVIQQNVASGFTGNINKVGTGILTFNGSNTYTGTTTVSGGVLAVNGSLQGFTSVASGGTVGGAGIVYGGLGVASGGIVAPGNNDAGTLTSTGVTSLSIGSSLNYILDAVSTTAGQGVNNLLQVNNNFYIGTIGTLNLAVNGGTSLTIGNTYTLVDFTGSLLAGGATASPTNNVQLGVGIGNGTSWSIATTFGEKLVLFLTPTTTLGGALDLAVATNMASISLNSASETLYTRPNVGLGTYSSNTYSVNTTVSNITTTGDTGTFSMSVASGSSITFNPVTGSVAGAANTAVGLTWSSTTGLTSAGARLSTISVLNTSNLDGVTTTTETIGGGVFNTATATLASTTVTLSNFRPGASGSGVLGITNSNLDNTSYQDQLNVTPTGTVAGLTATGFSSLTAGSTGSVNYSASASVAGAVSYQSTLGLYSNPTVSLSGESLGTATATIVGAAYDYANPNLATLSVNLGNHHVGDAASTANLAITNSVVTSASYQDELSVTGTNPNADVSVGSISALAAGNSSNLGFTVTTGSAGSLAGNSTLALQSVPTVSLTGRTTYATVSVTGGIYNYATGSVSSTVNLADAFVSASVASSSVSVSNTSPNTYSDALDAFGSGSPGITAGNATGIAGGNSSTINVAADTSFSHLGGGTVTVGLVSNGTAEGLGTTSVGSATVSVTGGNVYQHAVLVDPTVTIRVTQGDTASTTYSVSDLSSSPLRDSALVSTVTVSNPNMTTTASGMLPTTIAPGSSTVYSVSYASTSSVDSTAGNLAFTYGDLQTGLAGANNNNQTLTVAVNAMVDPIVEVSTLSNGTASINTAPDRIAAGNASGFIGTIAPTYITSGQYLAGILTESNMYNATGHAEGVVEVNVAPPTAALEPTTVLLFDFFNGAAETSAQSTDFSELTQDLSTFGYSYSTDTTTGALNFYDTNALYKPVGYTYELEVDLDSGPIAGMNPSQIDFNFSKYDLQVDNLLAVPEPTTMALLGSAGLGLLSRRRRNGNGKSRKA